MTELKNIRYETGSSVKDRSGAPYLYGFNVKVIPNQTKPTATNSILSLGTVPSTQSVKVVLKLTNEEKTLNKFGIEGANGQNIALAGPHPGFLFGVDFNYDVTQLATDKQRLKNYLKAVQITFFLSSPKEQEFILKTINLLNFVRIKFLFNRNLTKFKILFL